MSLVLLAFGHESRALELITAQEARLPDDPEGIRYGVAVGPSIIVVSPSAAGFSKTLFTHLIKNSPGCRRGFRVEM
jgi:hypothetical protein